MIFFKIITNFSITINNSTIEQVDYFNFLGVTLDQNITGHPHVDKVSIKISRVTGLLCKLQHYFPKHILITIYNSLIHSHLMYGVLVWGFQSMRVIKLQKKAIRVLANRPYISHTTPIFKELRILKITDQVQLYKLHYKNINNLCPVYFRIFAQFLTMCGDHNYDFRNTYFRLVVVVCLPKPMEGMGRLQFSDLFTEQPVPPQAAGVVGTFNVLLYIILSTTV